MIVSDTLKQSRTEQSSSTFDVARIRKDFPVLEQKVWGKPLIYLDNAATTQKPMAVIQAISNFYLNDNSNIHRAVHLLSERATAAYEGSREKIRAFIGAAETKEIVFVRGTTEAINLVASSFGTLAVKAGDEILVSAMEHHSNIVPWQMLCDRVGAKLKVVPITDRGELTVEAVAQLLTPQTKLLAVAHVSNALGSVNPVEELTKLCHAKGVAILIDGAQATPHMKVDVSKIGCDFYCFSAHKMYGPTGVGVLYGKEKWLEKMPPYQGGGDMISSVSFEKTTFNALPYKFEAGTPDISGVVALGAAVDYLEGLGMNEVGRYESQLVKYAAEQLQKVEGLQLIGTPKVRAGAVSFNLVDIHPHDVGTLLDEEGIAIRTGHHCAQPLMDRFQIPATCRASFGIYNTKEEVDALVAGLEKVKKIFV